MKKLEKRAILCLILAACLFLGLCLIVFRYVRNGHQWAMFYANEHVYTNGHLAVGAIYDRNGKLLAQNGKGTGGKPRYSDDYLTRVSTAHAVGDAAGFVSTGAESAFSDKIVGYKLLTGTYSLTGRGNDLKLSIDSSLNKTAYSALAGRKGLVAVYNYKTGEVVCMVSSPSFDPADPPSAKTAAAGTYLNKFISGRLTPGSIFKLVTSGAAIENLKDLDQFRYTCAGTRIVNGEKITCTEAHGTVDFKGALAKSCNGAFSVLADRVGAAKMKEYTEKVGLTTVYDMDGVKNTAGSFQFPGNAPLNLGWAGIGQWKDLLNPCSMLVYVSAIANGGEGVVPSMIHNDMARVRKTKQLIESSTASQLQVMMKNDVTAEYGAARFPGLDLYAKSGTAEVGGQRPNAWFTGFIKNQGCPYAFIVCVENGGSGAQVAGPIANSVLQRLVAARG